MLHDLSPLTDNPGTRETFAMKGGPSATPSMHDEPSMSHSATRTSLTFGLLAPALLAACTHVTDNRQSVARDDSCTTRVIVGFEQDLGPAPSTELISDVARAASVELTFVRAVGGGLYVFSLGAVDSDPSCGHALQRLRRDTRIRSVDVDVRRHPLG